jgi:hypothetical protein
VQVCQNRYTLLHVHPLLGNVFLNKFPGRQSLAKQSVPRPRNSRGSRVSRVRREVTTVDSDHMTFSVHPTEEPIAWLDSDHVICV